MNTNSKALFRIKLGHRSEMLEERTPKGHTHRWTIFVRSAGSKQFSDRSCITKVVFTLHPDFPNRRRVIRNPPFEVTETGYAGFLIPVSVSFAGTPKVYKLAYDMNLCLEKYAEHEIEQIVELKQISGTFLDLIMNYGGFMRKERHEKKGIKAAHFANDSIAKPETPSSLTKSDSSIHATELSADKHASKISKGKFVAESERGDEIRPRKSRNQLNDHELDNDRRFHESRKRSKQRELSPSDGESPRKMLRKEMKSNDNDFHMDGLSKKLRTEFKATEIDMCGDKEFKNDAKVIELDVCSKTKKKEFRGGNCQKRKSIKLDENKVSAERRVFDIKKESKRIDCELSVDKSLCKSKEYAVICSKREQTPEKSIVMNQKPKSNDKKNVVRHVSKLLKKDSRIIEEKSRKKYADLIKKKNFESSEKKKHNECSKITESDRKFEIEDRESQSTPSKVEDRKKNWILKISAKASTPDARIVDDGSSIISDLPFKPRPKQVGNSSTSPNILPPAKSKIDRDMPSLIELQHRMMLTLDESKLLRIVNVVTSCEELRNSLHFLNDSLLVFDLCLLEPSTIAALESVCSDDS